MHKMQYEDFLPHIGAFGKYQKVLIVLLYLIMLPIASQFLAQVFLAANADHWCMVPDSLIVNCTELQLDSASECQEAQKEQGIPYQRDSEGKRVYSSCERYATDDEGDTGSGESLNLTDVFPCDAGWDFDRSGYKSTINEDFNLVCDREDLPGIAQSVWFAGFLVGSLMWGSVGDWIGRRKTFILCLLLVSVFSIVTAFMPSFAAYTALRFFTASCSCGIMFMIFVIPSELVGPKKRVVIGLLWGSSFSLGYMFLSVMAYLFREWRHLQLAISIPFVLAFPLIIVVPESPRWLMSKGRFNEAKVVMKKISTINGSNVPDNLFEINENPQLQAAARQPQPTVTQLDLIRTPNIRKITLILWFDWFVVNLAYYGLSLNTSTLGINDYVAAFVSGAVELPGALFCWFVMERFGRRLTLAGLFAFAGLFCLITIFTPLGGARAATAMVGKFAIAAAFKHVYVYSGELYPTVIRSMGIGACSMAARISGILSPVILILGKYWGPLPMCVIGGSSVLAGILSLMLPETLGRSLLDSIAEGELFGKSPGLRLFLKRDSQGESVDSTQPPTEYIALSTRDVDPTAPTAV